MEKKERNLKDDIGLIECFLSDLPCESPGAYIINREEVEAVRYVTSNLKGICSVLDYLKEHDIEEELGYIP